MVRVVTGQNLFEAANFALLIFDYFCTLDAEVSNVWFSPWSLGIPLFYANRYLPIIDEGLMLLFGRVIGASAPACESLFKSSLAIAITSANASHTIIYLQTCALWGNGCYIVSLLGVLLVAELGVSTALAVHSFEFMKFLEPSPTDVGCRIAAARTLSQYTYVVVFVSETITIGLMLIKAVQHVRCPRSTWVSDLYQNGVLYSTVILLLSLANVIAPNVPWLARSGASILLTTLQHTMESVLCNRVIFGILQSRKRTSFVLEDDDRNPTFNSRRRGTAFTSEGLTSVVDDNMRESDLGLGSADRWR